MTTEKAKDNQWWYGTSQLRQVVDDARYVVLSIEGRECPLQHSRQGKDGRRTLSFTFMNPDDRVYWESLNRRMVTIELIECSDDPPDVDSADCSLANEADPLQAEWGAMANTVDWQPADPIQANVVRRVASQPTLFDSYVFIDWSAASNGKVGPDSIWIAVGTFDGEGVLQCGLPVNAPTRRQAESFVREQISLAVSQDRRVLVGFDFPYGYPPTWHVALGIENGEWDDLWRLLAHSITDDELNQNNRCAVAAQLNARRPGFVGPYWSRPNGPGGDYPSLPARRPNCFAGEVCEYRAVEDHLRANHLRPKSVWQLFGNGVAGSQALLGIPVLHRLRYDRELAPNSKVWPFETGWTCPRDTKPLVVHAEIWPGAIAVDRQLHQVKDAAQMLSYVLWAAQMDVAGELGMFFDPDGVPEGLAAAASGGWILGA